MTGFNSKRDAAADKLQEPVSFPCCGYTDAIKWNQFNGVVQCHMCGQVYTVAQPVQDSVTWFGIDFAKQYAIPAQEPVAWPCLIAKADFSQDTVTLTMQCDDYKVSAHKHWLSTTPPKRPWVGLTPEETSGFTQHEMTVVKYVSKVLQEKNT